MNQRAHYQIFLCVLMQFKFFKTRQFLKLMNPQSRFPCSSFNNIINDNVESCFILQFAPGTIVKNVSSFEIFCLDNVNAAALLFI